MQPHKPLSMIREVSVIDCERAKVDDFSVIGEDEENHDFQVGFPGAHIR